MTIGIQFDKPTVNQGMGGTALRLRTAFREAEEWRHFCLITPDAMLTGLGFSPAEVAAIKSAWADADTIVQAATGAGTIAVASNLMANLDQLAGVLQT